MTIMTRELGGIRGSTKQTFCLDFG